MKVNIVDSNFQEYNEFLLENKNSLFVSTIKYAKLLEWITGGKYFSIIVQDHDKIVGCLPTFLKQNEKYGNVLNSLPYYGSNPGIITKPNISNNDRIFVKKLILDQFHELAKTNNCICSTLISRPFEEDTNLYNEYIGHTFLDSRIGMFTPLPIFSKTIDKDLFDLIHLKTRNLVRKAQKSGITCYHNNNIDNLKFLSNVHQNNMEAVGAPPKGIDFFLKVAEIFEYDKDYRIYIAELNGIKIAALLLFYFNKTVEYFTPAVQVEYRNLQPLNLLIFNSMKDISEKGFKCWNWGGTTLPGMEGVYHFKKRWGSMECKYYYYTTFYKNLDIIQNLDRQTLLKEYPHFFVIPFSCLKGEST